jgi:hypothetical protein
MIDSQRMGGRRPALAAEHVPELLEIRAAMERIPPVKTLAHRWGVSPQTVRNYLHGRLPKRFSLTHGQR